MGLMKPRVSSYVDRGNELIAKGKTKQANLIRSLPNSVMFPGSYVYAPFDIRYQLPP